MTLSRLLKHKDSFPDPKGAFSTSVLLHAITQANDKSRRLLQVRNRNKGHAKCYNALEYSRLYQRTCGQLLAKPLYRCCTHKRSKGVSNSIHTVNSTCLRARVEVCLTPKKPCWSVSYAKKTLLKCVLCRKNFSNNENDSHKSTSEEDFPTQNSNIYGAFMQGICYKKHSCYHSSTIVRCYEWSRPTLKVSAGLCMHACETFFIFLLYAVKLCPLEFAWCLVEL